LLDSLLQEISEKVDLVWSNHGVFSDSASNIYIPNSP